MVIYKADKDYDKTGVSFCSSENKILSFNVFLIFKT